MTFSPQRAGRDWQKNIFEAKASKIRKLSPRQLFLLLRKLNISKKLFCS
jgi:hypothetical protein